MARRARKRGRKRAQGISINVIIIAAIALLVLVVLSVIFLGRIGVFTKATASCEGQGGQCLSVCSPPLTEFRAWTCPERTDKCCIEAGLPAP